MVVVDDNDDNDVVLSRVLLLIAQDATLSSHAVRALANLDRDFCGDDIYEEGVYLLHPEGRQR